MVSAPSAEREFGASIFDLTDENRPMESAVFLLEDISPDDHALVVPGAVFYWFIGYEKSRLGQVRRVSQIRFRRLPRARAHDDRLTKQADEITKRFAF